MNAEASGALPPMTPVQMAALVDAALRAPHPLAFLDTAAATFKMVGRVRDATATAWMGYLLAEGEVETLMGLRAAWRRGEVCDPAKAARRCERVRA